MLSHQDTRTLSTKRKAKGMFKKPSNFCYHLHDGAKQRGSHNFIWAATLNYWALFFFQALYGMVSFENPKLTEPFISIGWNTLWSCAELLFYPKSLDNGLTLQNHVKNVQNNFPVCLDKIFQLKCIWLDAKHGTFSNK